MKNFPHQINQIPKLVNALQVIRELIENNQNVMDDGVLGYALARAGVYTFRGHTENDDLEERIRIEQRKAVSSQGARTCARDLRRLFNLLGLVSINSAQCAVTALGNQIIETGTDVENRAVRQIWRQALVEMELFSEDGAVSHPYVIMLRLVEQIPNINVRKLALALEAKNDTVEEFNRILQIAGQANWTNLLDASEHQIRNATKILPALARQIGDIRVVNDSCFLNNEYIYTETVETVNETAGVMVNTQAEDNGQGETITDRGIMRTQGSRRVTAEEIATIPTCQDEESSGEENTTVDLGEAIKTRNERSVRHNRIVRSFANLLQAKGYELMENPMDCLGVRGNNPVILAEIKTLNGTHEDEVKQVRLALAQLTYYEAFNVLTLIEDPKVTKVALFESSIHENHIQYLQSYGCLVTWFEDGVLTGSTEAIEFFNAQGII